MLATEIMATERQLMTEIETLKAQLESRQALLSTVRALRSKSGKVTYDQFLQHLKVSNFDLWIHLNELKLKEFKSSRAVYYRTRETELVLSLFEEPLQEALNDFFGRHIIVCLSK